MALTKRNPPTGDRRVPGKFVSAGSVDRFQHSLRDPVLQASAEHLHRLGARALHEFVLELATVYGPEVATRLHAYRRIDPALLRAVGADRFPPGLVVMDGGRR